MVVKLIRSFDSDRISSGELVRAGQWRCGIGHRSRTGLKLFVLNVSTVRTMRCGGDGLKHRSFHNKKDRYHGTAWYGSTIPSRVHGKVLHGTAGYGSTIPSRDHDAVGGAGGDAVWRRRRRPKTSV
jgi:hypothetical protein